jgi:metal-responsive CopG/Arc/MetJ family transcriptional regulator
MTEKVISVKMPTALVKELKHLTHEHHYIDLSEQVRSVVRQKCLKYSQQESGKLLGDIERQIKESNQQRKEQILRELQKLLEGER